MRVGGTAMTTPAPFTASDYAARMSRAGAAAEAEGFAGVLVAPGPDLTYLCGYAPPAATERLTLLIVQPGRLPVLVVPSLERGDAARSTAASEVNLVDWADVVDPHGIVSGLLDIGGRYTISDNAWAMHLLGLQRAAPRTAYRSMNDGLPMLRAVKDRRELERLALAADSADAAY